MRRIGPRSTAFVLLLSPLLLAVAGEAAATKEEFVFAALAGVQDEEDVIAVLARIESEVPDSTLAAAKVAPFLHDERLKVRRKAVRTLGILPFRLDAAALADVAKMLASSSPDEVTDALRGIRWLYSQATIPLVLPLLGNADEHVKREACRTLAIVGDRSVAEKIEPLLKDPVADTREDAEAAIAQLRRKP